MVITCGPREKQKMVHHASNIEKHRVADVRKALNYAKVWAWDAVSSGI